METNSKVPCREKSLSLEKFRRKYKDLIKTNLLQTTYTCVQVHKTSETRKEQEKTTKI